MRLVEIESEYLYTYTHIERVIHHNSSVRLPVYSFSQSHSPTQFFSFCTFGLLLRSKTNFSICHQESPFSQPILNRKMGATSTDNDKMDTGGEETTTDKEEEIDPSKTLINNVSLIKKSVESKGEPRFIASVFRQTHMVRAKLNNEVISAFIETVLPSDSESLPTLKQFLKGKKKVEEEEGAEKLKSDLPETEIYCYVVALMHMIDAKDASSIQLSEICLHRLSSFNRRTLDAFAAKVYFYYSLAHERFGNIRDARQTLLALHRQATSRLDAIGQETTLNLLLRNYVSLKQYELAEQLRSKTVLPSSRSSAQQCRYLYYLGRIRAIQLEYTEAKECLTQALRKAPNNAAWGFKLILTKWICIVRLLLGEIPERKFLSSPSEMRSKLLPYFELTSAVRAGDLHEFALVVEKHRSTFEKDNVFNLITRLRRNVIRTGLAKVNVAYSKISLNDIALKLGLKKDVDMSNTSSNNINNEGAIECVVAKAIRDGAVDAQIDFETGIMTSNETKDAYGTSLPAEVFHQRVAYCLDVHNECQRAMRYAEKSSNKTNETKEERMKRLEDEEALREFMEEEEDYF